jgi:hypothetical protein
MYCFGNKNYLLCVIIYTYVLMLIVDKRWKKSLEHFCGLGMKPLISFFNIKKEIMIIMSMLMNHIVNIVTLLIQI